MGNMIELDVEWIELMKEARSLGIKAEEIQIFLKEAVLQQN